MNIRMENEEKMDTYGTLCFTEESEFPIIDILTQVQKGQNLVNEGWRTRTMEKICNVLSSSA